MKLTSFFKLMKMALYDPFNAIWPVHYHNNRAWWLENWKDRNFWTWI